MKIAIDAMGGDNAPKAVVEGCIDTANEYDIEIFLIGNEKEVEKYLNGVNPTKGKIHIVHADEVITGEDTPVQAIKQKKNSSMVVGLKMVKDGECDAFLSAGNTGAFLAGALLKVGRIKGIDRPALAPLLPTEKGVCMLIDAGANMDCKPKNLLQFAIMGAIYMEKVEGILSPRVGLLNVGTEEGKGNDLTKQSYELLKNSSLNFVGNVEARDIFSGACDVLVCDGFAGNVVLKNTEGLASTIFSLLKEELMKSTKSKFGALLLKDSFKSFKKRFDYKEYGGAPFLGIDGIMIKAHGSSDSRAIKNAIRQAKLLYDNGCIDRIAMDLKDTGVNDVEQ
ncbi:phosphate acyltransferase PlsX [Lutispora thermophila]|uniref:Phosphate acyltransferase n=1 Tax=Lutispora thermophila DSM 19022 TaxID=1122184 RepID=A0A1M6G4M7_9FIRM|nr:phosphate acyltransferase PlsX [Lutispora thermophila]SHJ04854.1 phosphate:acyl-[acyl carrier protein] acyltransferase [Lutispora thermophila DSM 19022]